MPRLSWRFSSRAGWYGRTWNRLTNSRPLPCFTRSVSDSKSQDLDRDTVRTYPDFAYSKLLASRSSPDSCTAVGSYIIQAWRLFDLRVEHHPPYWMAFMIALLIYANFFTHHYIGDYRWYFAACALGSMLAPPSSSGRSTSIAGCCSCSPFVLIGFFIWLAENISTFFGIWRYPNQFGAWSTVHLGEVELLVTARDHVLYPGRQPQHIKERVHVPA